MNAQVEDNCVNLEIDGRTLKGDKGAMIIQVADDAGISIPRFCYHPKLKIAANCRMCLVEVEMNGKLVPKPLPACATPISEGMKVQTRSDNALKWQRDVMEFLLINHPLDCPICDQGGECELQDLSLGYGRSVSRFTEAKRNVADEDIGPLVETFMTRCIHCTRCVRVLDEIAGTHEFGGMNRGEHLEIGTYIGKSIESELGGNIIDVCPVGALTDKVFKFKARAWELVARKSLGYHDALGSNLWLHTRHGKVLRAVPRDNETVNECWLSDRDRYSHEGLYHEERLATPMVREGDGWKAVSWEAALAAVQAGLKGLDGNDIGILAHPATSCEEGLLLRRLADGLACGNLDHRLRQQDFSATASKPFEMPVADLQQVDAALLVGSHLRHELPLVNHRLRDSVLAGGKVFVIGSLAQDVNFPLAGRVVAPPQKLVDEVLVLAAAAQELDTASKPDDASLRDALQGVDVTDAARAAVNALAAADKAVLVFGQQAAMHPEAAWLRAAVQFIAVATGSALNEVPLGANAIGLSRMGVLPSNDGMHTQGMLRNARKAYLLYGIEPPFDFADGALADEALSKADFVVACSAFFNKDLQRLADVVLPIAPLPMSPATLVNVDGLAQRAEAAVPPVAETQSEYRAMGDAMQRPQIPASGEVLEGWKVLRGMGRELNLDGFDVTDWAQLQPVVDESLQGAAAAKASTLPPRASQPSTGLTRMDTVPIYRGDAVLRRAKALNDHPLTRAPEVVMAPADAQAMGVADGQTVRVTGDVELPLRTDARVSAGSVWIESGHEITARLLPMGATISVDKA